MNAPNAVITSYNIKEVHSYAGELPTKDFFVYKGEEVTVPDNIYHPSRSEHFAIHLSLDDSIILKYNLIDYPLKKNSVFIIHPGVVHALKEVTVSLPAISTGFTHDFLAASMVHKKYAESLGFLSVNSNPLFLVTDKEAQTLYGLLLYLKEMIGNHEHPFKQEMIHHGFNLFILELAAIAKKYRAAGDHAITRKEDILIGFLKQLSDHFKEERSVQFYAGTLFITPKHLNKTIKEVTGRSCGDFIDEMVITEAKILLGDLSYSVAQVADHLHFSDQFFFSKFFKRRTGLSPKEYKHSL